MKKEMIEKLNNSFSKGLITFGEYVTQVGDVITSFERANPQAVEHQEYAYTELIRSAKYLS